MPIQLTSVKRAVNLLFMDVAVGVDHDYETYPWERLIDEDIPEEKASHFYFLKTVTRKVPVPKVVVLNEFDKKPPQTVKFSRSQVFVRDRFTCQYCSKSLPKQKLNIDHVVPRMLGGKTNWENVVTSCHPCNRRKGGRTPAQAGMQLLSTPRRPAVPPLMSVLRTVNRAWQPFLFGD